MDINKILTGESKIIVSFEEYFTHLNASEFTINTFSRTIQLNNAAGAKINTIQIGTEAFIKIKKLKLNLTNTDYKLLDEYSVLMNGFMGKDWLFVMKDFSKQIIGKER